jgi:hypothetical protein
MFRLASVLSDSRKDIKFLSLVEDHPVFPKNVCKNLLFFDLLYHRNGYNEKFKDTKVVI